MGDSVKVFLPLKLIPVKCHILETQDRHILSTLEENGSGLA